MDANDKEAMRLAMMTAVNAFIQHCLTYAMQKTELGPEGTLFALGAMARSITTLTEKPLKDAERKPISDEDAMRYFQKGFSATKTQVVILGEPK